MHFHFDIINSNLTEINIKSRVFWASDTKQTFTPEIDCDVLVSLEMDGWGYAGGIWQFEIAISSASGLNLPTEGGTLKRGILNGDDLKYTYARTKSYYYGLKAGETYTFELTTTGGQAGGYANPHMMLEMY